MAEIFTRPYLLAGEKQSKGELTDVTQPGESKPFGRVYFAGEAEVLQATAAATEAFKETRKLATHVRAGICNRVAQELSEDKERIASELAREAGKPIALARGEVDRAVLTFRTAATEAAKIGGELLDLDVVPDAEGTLGITRRFPIGPVAAITPFNFPLNLVAHKMAPAVACGCPIVVKPASATPCSALNLGNLLIRAGWPRKAISVLPCSSRHVTPLVEDDRYKLITFTGSGEVGWGIKARAGKKGVALELGGNAAAVIDEGADLEYAAKRCAVGSFAYAGQSCISTQRILVHWNVKQDFLRLLMQEVQMIKMAEPMVEGALLGPMINLSEAERVESWIKEAQADGAHILCGGNRNGVYLEPTLITRAKPEMKVWSQEVFGPVAVVDTFGSWEEAVEKVNDSDYGLQAGIFTNDINKVFDAFEDIDVGGLVVNDMPTFRVDPQPYGGSKDSGVGREGPRYAIEKMTEIKVMLLRRR